MSCSKGNRSNYWLLVGLYLLLFAACSRDKPQPVQPDEGCPPDPIPIGGKPSVAVILPRVSLDRRYIAWVTGRGTEPLEHLWLFDRSSSRLRELQLSSFIEQPTVVIAIAKLAWSPYPSSKLLL